MKGVSPLVASVLLIAITLAVAAMLANYIGGFTQSTLQNLPTCIGGFVNYASADYPKWDDASSSIIAVVEAQSVPLGRFKFVLTLTNDTVLTYDDATSRSIAAGSIGDVRTGTLPFSKSSVKDVIITTNCSNVKTDRAALR